MGNLINSDIYNLTETVNDLQKQHMPEETEKTRSTSINSYFADINSSELQNAVVISSEMANEMWPSRAKYEKNVIAHSIIQNITDINATPARIQVHLGFEEDVVKNIIMESGVMIVDKDIQFYIGGYEYHLPYDIRLELNVISNNEEVYTARYVIDHKNNVSDITNPYLNAPFIQIYNTKKYIIVSCVLMQYEYSVIERKMITNNPIENKTFEFEFENQLCDFEIRVTDSDDTVYLAPMFEGMGINNNVENYCYYNYTDAKTIRVRFDSISYMPKINSKVEVLLKTTHGTEGNFPYTQNMFYNVASKRFGYSGLSVYIIINSDSEKGRDRRTTDELRRQLPKEALSRGSITTMQDLQNYFNMTSTESDRFNTQKKVDNQFERSYYAYLVLKDSYDNVIPTNTLDVIVAKYGNEFDTHDNRKYVLKPGCAIALNKGDNTGYIMNRDDVESYLAESNNNFVYTVPFVTVVNDDPLYVSYYMTVMKYARYLKFSYINQNAALQFIATNVAWRRGFLEDPKLYKLDVPLVQNINADKGIIKVDENGHIVETHIKMIAVFCNNGAYDDGTTPYRYFEGTLKTFSSGLTSQESGIAGLDNNSNYTLNFHFEFETNDLINDDAKLKILNTKIPGENVEDYGYFSGNVNVKLYILTDLEDDKTRYDLDPIVPGLEDWTVTNIYTIEEGLDFFINYTNIISSTVTSYIIQGEYENKQGFYIRSVPLLRYTYGDTESTVQEFMTKLSEKKAYIDHAITILENNFNIDFKLFNTYGPSRTYSLDRAGEQIIDRVNLTLNFEIRLVKASDVYTKQYIIRDIKKIIEDLNDMSNLHIPNLITTISNKYVPNSIDYIEFLGFNEYGPGVQHLYRNEYDDVTVVPEFLAVNVNEELTPSINIRVV